MDKAELDKLPPDDIRSPKGVCESCGNILSEDEGIRASIGDENFDHCGAKCLSMFCFCLLDELTSEEDKRILWEDLKEMSTMDRKVLNKISKGGKMDKNKKKIMQADISNWLKKIQIYTEWLDECNPDSEAKKQLGWAEELIYEASREIHQKH